MADDMGQILRNSLDAAKLGHTEKLDGFKRLDRFVRMVEAQREPRVDLAPSFVTKMQSRLH